MVGLSKRSSHSSSDWEQVLQHATQFVDHFDWQNIHLGPSVEDEAAIADLPDLVCLKGMVRPRSEYDWQQMVKLSLHDGLDLGSAGDHPLTRS